MNSLFLGRLGPRVRCNWAPRRAYGAPNPVVIMASFTWEGQIWLIFVGLGLWSAAGFSELNFLCVVRRRGTRVLVFDLSGKVDANGQVPNIDFLSPLDMSGAHRGINRYQELRTILCGHFELRSTKINPPRALSRPTCKR